MFKQIHTLTNPDQKMLRLLREYIGGYQSVCVAYSGGVDSSLIAAIAKEQLGSKALAVTGVSPSLAPHLLKEAREQATWIGIHHQECKTSELEDTSYNKNPTNRCYACKRELHKHLTAIAEAANDSQVLNGVNFDDLHDHRPGIDAAKEAGALSPLAELKIGKTSIRQISYALGFPWWGKPAQPCLASRFPYGEEINENKLKQVSQAEDWLRAKGFNEVRVRSKGLSASIEVPHEQIEELIIKLDRDQLITSFLSFGFTSISIDMDGLISGKLNRSKSIKSNFLQLTP